MAKVLYTDGIQHTPLPRGPHAVGAVDVCTRGSQGVLLRLFYPTLTREDDPRHWPRWHLGPEYSHGEANFITNFYRAIHSCSVSVINWLSSEVRVPSSWCSSDLPEGGFPVVVLSHGMAAHRTFLSTISTDLASHGYMVAAIEHREGSAAACLRVDDEGARKICPFIGYMGDDQFSKRVEEIFQTLSFLDELNAGDVTNAFTKDEVPLSLSVFKGKLDTDNVVLLGHSYGGASVLKALADERSHRFKAGVALDPWMFPLREHVMDVASGLRVPVRCISSWAFNDGPNLKALAKYEANVSNPDLATYQTIRNTVHYHGNDSPWIAGKICWAFVGGFRCLPPEMVNQLQNNIIINFFDSLIDRPTPAYKEEYEKYIEDHNHLIVHGNKFRN
ncbi:platelet-activating factor acetylhydrolase-like [Oratosquilla oratoria]|uniref:platelet-activating factor acetylhydrolase-like n=1 Tax=Oratosquilla oratoria TaxID=337810 RepID=UPI003F766056